MKSHTKIKAPLRQLAGFWLFAFGLLLVVARIMKTKKFEPSRSKQKLQKVRQCGGAGSAAGTTRSLVTF